MDHSAVRRPETLLPFQGRTAGYIRPVCPRMRRRVSGPGGARMRRADVKARSGLSRIRTALAAACSALALLCAIAAPASASDSSTAGGSEAASADAAIDAQDSVQETLTEGSDSDAGEGADSDAGVTPPAADPPPPGTPPPSEAPVPTGTLPPSATPVAPATPLSEAQPTPPPDPAKPTNPPKPSDDKQQGKDGEPKSKEPPKGDRPNRDKEPRNGSRPGGSRPGRGTPPSTGTQPGHGSQPGNGTQPGNGSQPGNSPQPGGGGAPTDREDAGGGRDRDANPESGESAVTPEREPLPAIGASSPVAGTQAGSASCAGHVTAAGYPLIPPVASTTRPGAQGVPEASPFGARLAAMTAPPKRVEIAGPALLRGQRSSLGQSTSFSAGAGGPALAAPAYSLDLGGARFAVGRTHTGSAKPRRSTPRRAEPNKRERPPHGPFDPPSNHTPTTAGAASASASAGLARSIIWGVLVMATVTCAARRLRHQRIPPVRFIAADFVPVLERPG
jgi:hypothetical protein